MRKKSKTNGLKCTLSQDSVLLGDLNKEFLQKAEMKGGPALCWHLSWHLQHCRMTGAGYEKSFDCQRTVAPLSERPSWLMCGAGKEGWEQMWGGRSEQRENNLNETKGGGKNTKEGKWEERGRERSVWCFLAEHLLSIETPAQPGENTLFLLDHETEQHCPENVLMAANTFLLSCFLEQKLDFYWRVWKYSRIFFRVPGILLNSLQN